MKNGKIITTIALAVLVTAGACKKDFLNTEPQNEFSSESTWTDGPLAQAFVFNVYSYLGYGGFEEQMLAAYTDEAMFTHAGRNINTFTEGAETPSNPAWFSGTYSWNTMYEAIRDANIAINRLPGASFDDQPLKDRLLGEAYFLRGYYYQQLMRFYGGVPLVKRPYGLNEDYSIERSSFEATVASIVSDLDSAALLLEGKPVTPGRASKLSAMALKSRVLLYAASDLHDANTAKSKSATLSSFSNIELVAYNGGDRTARWQAAKNAAKAVIDAGTGYKLDLTAPVSAEEGKNNYVSLSMGGGSKAAEADAAAAAELIFFRTLSGLYTQESNWPLGGLHFGINNGPNGYHNWGGNTPIQQLVDDYEMMDGSKFDWNDPDHKADPYTGRDPRFYATVLYDGAPWKPRPSDVIGLDPVSQIQTGYYNNGSGTINGIDTRSSSVENWNGSRTHYYNRKFIDPNPALPDNQSNFQLVPWPFVRYTEVVLNYIEACIALGEEAEARAWLNKIRFRAGMPAVTDAGQDLVNRYRNERRVELAFEEHRYHDARRWMIASETVGRGIKSIIVNGTLKSGATPHIPYRHDKSRYNYTYTVVDNNENERRKWDDKMYYRPILRDEMNRNDKLIQNPGY